MKIKIYVEGGGDSKDLHTRLQEAVHTLLARAGLSGKMPRIVAKGGGGNTIKSFIKAIEHQRSDEFPLLLVDTEDPLSENIVQPDDEGCWEHLAKRGKWKRPEGGLNSQIAFMATSMETWIAASPIALSARLGKCFKPHRLVSITNIETRNRAEVRGSVKKALEDCGDNKEYEKGKRSFQLLGYCDPAELTKNCTQFRRFIQILNEKSGE